MWIVKREKVSARLSGPILGYKNLLIAEGPSKTRPSLFSSLLKKQQHPTQNGLPLSSALLIPLDNT